MSAEESEVEVDHFGVVGGAGAKDDVAEGGGGDVSLGLG